MAAGQTQTVPVRPVLQPVRGAQLPAGARVAVNIAAIPAFAPVAIQLLSIVSQEYVGLEALASLIRADPAMTVEVLRLANSALFGARREITGILPAIAMLGLNRIKSMVMTVAIRDLLAPARHSRVFAPCWRHSLATAFLAEEIATQSSLDRDNSYTAGLIHEVGQLGLLAARPADYDELVRTSDEEGRSLVELEREWFGTDHREVGVRLIDRWKLPGHFRTVLAHGAASGGAAALVHTACRLAEIMGFRVAGAAEEFDAAQLPGLPPDMLREPAELEELMASVATKINAVECSLAMV